jgi:DNA-directed RNA polymerase specialized sigma24 family protein
MRKDADTIHSRVKEMAEAMIQRYVAGLLSGDWLAERLYQAWHETQPGGEASLELLARGLCSQVLFEACFSEEGGRRERAFANLRQYLETTLAHITRKSQWETNELHAEALQQTMIEIFKSVRKPSGRPEQPTAFLKWARVILFRQLARCQQQIQHENWLSLDEQDEPALMLLIDKQNSDPLTTILRGELFLEIKAAIAALRNPQYRAVLNSTFFSELEERELAARWQVRVQDIYLWRCRALKALRKQLGIEEALRQLIP